MLWHYLLEYCLMYTHSLEFIIVHNYSHRQNHPTATEGRQNSDKYQWQDNLSFTTNLFLLQWLPESNVMATYYSYIKICLNAVYLAHRNQPHMNS